MKYFIILVFLTRFYFGFAQAYSATLHKQLYMLTKEAHDFAHRKELNALGDSILHIMNSFSDDVRKQEFLVGGSSFFNVVATFKGEVEEQIIVGAHYDACGEQPGADDNASGVAGLLELARLLKGKKPHYTIVLVAYTLEEPPNFRTKNMGSYIHAKSLVDQNVKVKGMVCLEMIGYFKEEKKTQHYPVGVLRLFYGSRGNYIANVKKFGSGKFAKQFQRNMKKGKHIYSRTITAPKWITGIDFSEHLWYWHFGFSAIMVTDTAFYRNANYHEKTDTIASLDLNKMAKVIDGVFEALMELN